MKKLSWGLLFLVLVFATSMSFISLSVYQLEWWWGAIGVGILVVFIALGGLIVPRARKAVDPDDKQIEKAMLRAFGAFCAMLFLTMALVTWILGARYVTGNWYQVLGLLIFLAFAGVGLQGAVATGAWLFYIWNTTRIDRRLADGATPAAA